MYNHEKNNVCGVDECVYTRMYMYLYTKINYSRNRYTDYTQLHDASYMKRETLFSKVNVNGTYREGPRYER